MEQMQADQPGGQIHVNPPPNPVLQPPEIVVQAVQPPETNDNQTGVEMEDILASRKDVGGFNGDEMAKEVYSIISPMLSAGHTYSADMGFMKATEVKSGMLLVITEGRFEKIARFLGVTSVWPKVMTSDIISHERVEFTNSVENHLLVLSEVGIENFGAVIEKANLDDVIPGFQSSAGISMLGSQSHPSMAVVTSGPQGTSAMFKATGMFASAHQHSSKSADRIHNMVPALKILGGNHSLLVEVTGPVGDLTKSDICDNFVGRALKAGKRVLTQSEATKGTVKFGKMFSGRIGLSTDHTHLKDFRIGQSGAFSRYEDVVEAFNFMLQVLAFMWADTNGVLKAGFEPLTQLITQDWHHVSLRTMFGTKPCFVEEFLDRVLGLAFTGMRDGSLSFVPSDVVHNLMMNSAVNMQLVFTEWAFEPVKAPSFKRDGSDGQQELGKRALKKLKAGGGADGGRGGGGARGDGGRGRGGTQGGGGAGGLGGGGGRGGGGGNAQPGGSTSTSGLCAGHLAHLLLPATCKPCNKAGCNFEHKPLPTAVAKTDKDNWVALLTRVIRSGKRLQDILAHIAALP